MNIFPSRLVCLSAEIAETLCLLGEGSRIVGFAGPSGGLPTAQQRKPRVSVRTHTRVDRICVLDPDLVLGVGGQHGEILGALAQRGVAVHLFSHRSVRGILDMVRLLGGMVGREEAAAHLAASLEWRIEAIRTSSGEPPRPKIYVEQWNEPLTSAGSCVSELIDIAGGENCFADLASYGRQEDRIIDNPDEVVRRAPDIIIGAWMGKTFEPERVVSRAGWHRIPAVINGELHEMESSLILQPGPAALTQGLAALRRLIEAWRERRTRMFQTALAPGSLIGLRPESEIRRG